MMLHPGIIKTDTYHQLLKSETFQSMEKFNDNFLEKYKNELNLYHSKWTNDSLHNWSRVWEYPFISEEIKKYLKTQPNAKILDAGSGLTFFSYMLKQLHPTVDVICTDYDPILVESYEKVNKKADKSVSFELGDLRKLSFEDASFDIIYCVSVLEHTDTYPEIVKNFKRLLKPGGILIITFDISLNSDTDISIEGAQRLVENLNQNLKPVYPEETISKDILAKNNVLTTNYVAKFDKRLLPWRSPWKNAIKNLINFRVPRSIFSLACYCQVYKKD